jgi:DNA repair protein RecO (recombination protein O)
VAFYRDEGVVLRTYRLGEADRIVVMMTRGHGKVRAVAKGVRRTTSRFGGRLEPPSHVAVQLYAGRELDIVTQVETIEAFRPVREDLDRLARATMVLEAVDQVSREREADAGLYRMLVGALRTLAASSSPVVVPAFFWKLLAHEGFSPVLDACVVCGAAADLVAFDIAEGGVSCRACRRGTAVSPAARALIARVLGGELGRVLAERIPQAVVAEVDALATRALEHHLERRLRSAGVL